MIYFTLTLPWKNKTKTVVCRFFIYPLDGLFLSKWAALGQKKIGADIGQVNAVYLRW